MAILHASGALCCSEDRSYVVNSMFILVKQYKASPGMFLAGKLHLPGGIYGVKYIVNAVAEGVEPWVYGGCWTISR